MTRVIVHAGFHKTGTTSLQDFLARNRKAFRPYCKLYIRGDLKRSFHLCRVYGSLPVIATRLAFRYAFRQFLKGIPDSPAIVLSRECFSGVVLGNPRALCNPSFQYAPIAVRLAREIIRELRRRFGTDTQIEFLYTTRERDAFLQSTYAHVVAGSRLALDAPDFFAQFDDGFSLENEAGQIATKIDPVKVHIEPLENVATSPFGPGEILLRVLGVPETEWDRFVAPRKRNQSQPKSLESEFLALNRSGLRGQELKDAKLALVKAQGTRK